MDDRNGSAHVHEKVVRSLALAELPPNAYDDGEIGPLKPGCGFFQWLLHGPPLQLPIAETYLCHRGGGMTVVRTCPTTGYLLKERHTLTSETAFDDESNVDLGLVRGCVDRVVAQAAPLIQLPSIYNLPLPAVAGSNDGGARYAEECVDRPADALTTYQRPTLHERLQHRFVAVLKRPLVNPRAAAGGDAMITDVDSASDTASSAADGENGEGNEDAPKAVAKPLQPQLVVATETELLQVRPIHIANIDNTSQLLSFSLPTRSPWPFKPFYSTPSTAKRCTPPPPPRPPPRPPPPSRRSGWAPWRPSR